MSKKRVQCKFFAHGACLKGDHCEFLHDWNAPQNNICTFYQKGACAYGSRCRYEHVKVSRPLSSASSSSSSSSANPSQYLQSKSILAAHPSGAPSVVIGHASGATADSSLASRSMLPTTKPAGGEMVRHEDVSEFSDFGETKSRNPADQPICSFAAAGHCPRGEMCPHIHGDLCPTCEKHCLHPFRPEEREDHVKLCERRQKNLDALKHSQEIECSVCLERVLSKPTAAERKFGILSECDHPFCISCIRNWRSSSPASGMDVNSALRACPICRKLSYFVIPSVIWYSTKEEKQEIVDSYKGKLRSIDCKHFDFGNGTCPFGTSCFYKHTVKPGSYLWNSTLMPDLYRTRFMDSDEEECLSETVNKNALLYLFEHFYSPHISAGVEEDFSSEDSENEMAEELAFMMMLGL
ncbi:putative RING-type E3 ubiquitin transferase C3H69 isoform X1 [Coffea eugenioides]|uniref:putative RING-type E3 ubiquitin transferase C3H69 isoform X1 n=1 Tax=Coffea eugenioides TaxID=49369 RepID=UPI000F60B940|nr:putative RING-type E3 ubiquitin transferase C3H69 isoform X1 [Coffea eugenioides]